MNGVPPTNSAPHQSHASFVGVANSLAQGWHPQTPLLIVAILRLWVIRRGATHKLRSPSEPYFVCG